jgi:hypothetical protein
MRRARSMRGNGKIGCVIWLAIAAVIGYGLYKIVPVKIASSRFEDFMNEEASFGSIKTSGQLEKEILARARELQIPVTKDNLSMRKTKDYISIEAHYELTVEFFGGAFKYVWKFDPVAKRPLFAV